MSRPVVAAFDFDDTLSAGVSGLRFFRQLLGPWGYAWLCLRHLPALVCYGLRWRHEQALERLNHAVFTGREAAVVAQAAEFFARENVPRFLVPSVLARLHWHQAQGHRCVIVSRGYEIYLRPWARAAGLVEVIATRLAVGADGRLTGLMPEPSCDGSEKRERLRAMIGERETCELHAYGDGPGDYALLADADHAWIRTAQGLARWRPKGDGA